MRIVAPSRMSATAAAKDWTVLSIIRGANLPHWQADVILGKRGGPGARAGHIVQLGELHPVLKVVAARKSMQHRSHPPRKALRLPDAPQHGRGITCERL